MPIQRLFAYGGTEHGGWQGVRIPGAGRWTLRLEYQGRAAYRGLAISAVAWFVWLMAYWRGKNRTAETAENAEKTGE